MFDLCGRNAKSVINYYVSYELDGNDYSVTRIFPVDVPKTYATRIREFGFSCCKERKAGERFVLVFTDADGNLEFVFCHSPTEKNILCISSALPWFACFHGILDILWFNELHRDSRWHLLHPWLARLVSAIPPKEPINYFMCPDPFRCHQGLKLKIPNSFAPHNPKYVMEYYNALDVSLWIHIFVRLILERSVLFCSNRLSRLTSCVLAAVSLLYPLQWVHSFYPLIPRKAIEVLGCPVPFVAGIHACNLQAALEHVTPGTCLVNLDSGTVEFPSTFDLPDGGSELVTLTPKAVFHFLRRQLKDILRQVNVAFSQKNPKANDWKRVDGQSCNIFEQLTKPFFCLLLNLFGSYKECLVDRGEHLEVDTGLLIARQNCADLEPFLNSLCDTQTVQLFLDSRARNPPDHTNDAFECACHTIYIQSNKRKNWKPTSIPESPILLKPVPLSDILNGTVSYPESASPYDNSLFIHTGLKRWLQSKKIKCPGELCPWDYDTNFAEPKNVHVSTNSQFTTWTQKFLAQAASLKNLSRPKDAISVDRSRALNFPVHNTPIRSQSSRSRPARPSSIPEQVPHEISMSSRSLLNVPRGTPCETNSCRSSVNTKNTKNRTNGLPEFNYKPPRPPPPRLSVEETLDKSIDRTVADLPLPAYAPSEHSRPSAVGGYSHTSTGLHEPPNTQQHFSYLHGHTSVNPPPLPPRPKWVLERARKSLTLNTRPIPNGELKEFDRMRPSTGVLSPSHSVSTYSTAHNPPDQRPSSTLLPLTTSRPVSLLSSPSIDLFPLVPTGQLLLRRMNRWSGSPDKIDSSQSQLRCSAIGRQTSTGDSSVRSTVSRTSSDSHLLRSEESEGTKSENDRADANHYPPIRCQSSSLYCLAVGDTDTWLPNATSQPNGEPQSFRVHQKITRQKCATFSQRHNFPKGAEGEQNRFRKISCKSWSDLPTLNS